MKKMMKLFNNCTKEVKAESTKEDFEKKMSVRFPSVIIDFICYLKKF